MIKMVNKKQLEKELKKVVAKDWEIIKGGVWWTDGYTFATHFPLTDNLRKIIYDNNEFWQDVDGVLNAMLCEYWVDENKFVYELTFDTVPVIVTERVQCDFLDEVILQLVKMTQ